MTDITDTTDDSVGATSAPASQREGAARWSRLASLGLTLAGIGPLLMLAAALAWGLDVGDELGFFIVSSGLAFGGAALVRQSRVWMKAIGVVLGLLMGMMLFWTAFGIAMPNSVFEFMPGLMVLPGALLGLGAGIASIRALRRGDLVAQPVDGERKAMRTILVALGAAAVVSVALTVAGRTTVSDEDVDLVVKMSSFEFEEESYDVEGGDRILVENDDPFAHTFTIDALDIDEAINPLSEKVITIPKDPGDYLLYCQPHTADKDDPSEDDMTAQLKVS